MLARTLKPGPRYLLIVLALAGDSTMTSFCPLREAPPSGRAAALGLRVVFRAGLSAPLAVVVFLRPPLAGEADGLADGFLRAGTGRSVVAVVFSCRLATIHILNEGRLSPILYPFAGCQVRQVRRLSFPPPLGEGKNRGGGERAKGSSAHGL